ncbi:hypothetical protein H9L19_05940 [Weissella diestrammenae]|uniref:ABC transporter permease subunit n=1 Tax=Weissella diestrammenae TaxID=1162633 RepID=A0A7G9T4A5_9LACO|nr:hypothetical protein [Weissella diestrammenae]MCM0583462.1 hypothetical protein [Weissella diestrammenae]QNN74930.1 hypothetical protein H9L19_05940 [Weissella diestrammenae]
MPVLIWCEIRRELLTFKSIIVVAFIVSLSVFIGEFGANVKDALPNGDSSIYTSLFSLFALFGFIFSMMIFSGIVASEIESGTIRLILPYFDRKLIYIARWLAIFSYFIFLIITSIVIVSFLKMQFLIPWGLFGKTACFFAYCSSVVMFVSSSFSKVKTANFIGVLIGIGSLIVYIADRIDGHSFFHFLDYLMPYQYIDNPNGGLILVTLSIIFGLLGWFVLTKKEV